MKIIERSGLTVTPPYISNNPYEHLRGLIESALAESLRKEGCTIRVYSLLSASKVIYEAIYEAFYEAIYEVIVPESGIDLRVY